MGKMYSRFQTKTVQKPYPIGGAHTYIAYMRENPHTRPVFWLKKTKTASRKHLIPPPTLKQKTNWKYLK